LFNEAESLAEPEPENADEEAVDAREPTPARQRGKRQPLPRKT